MAGTIREMARMLGAKNDLQAVVVSLEYERRKSKFVVKKRRGGDEDDDDKLSPNIGDTVKGIIIDESHFWPELANVLRLTLPIVTLLRLMDSNKPCLGKVYKAMSNVQAHISASSVAWKADAERIHSRRWAYLHSPIHAAAYALDPHNIEVVNDNDIGEHCQKGFLKILERMCIRDVLLSENFDLSSSEAFKAATAEVTASYPAVVKRVAQGEREFAAYAQLRSIVRQPSSMQGLWTPIVGGTCTASMSLCFKAPLSVCLLR